MEIRLQQKCEQQITYGITTKNVLELLTMAEKYSLKVYIVCDTCSCVVTYNYMYSICTYVHVVCYPTKNTLAVEKLQPRPFSYCWSQKSFDWWSRCLNVLWSGLSLSNFNMINSITAFLHRPWRSPFDFISFSLQVLAATLLVGISLLF